MNYQVNKIKVLDHGFVELLDHMGSDQSIVESARQSYNDEPEAFRDKVEDKRLLAYLMSHFHTSPFEQAEFQFRMKMPLFVARQIVRHRTASLNEFSGRYSEMPDEMYLPDMDRYQSQDSVNKQGSSGLLEKNVRENIRMSMKGMQNTARKKYISYLDNGLSKELARINLPLTQYTVWTWKIDLHNLFHFLRLRMDEHAQWEAQEYAKAIYFLIKPIVPLSCEVFEEYRLYARNLSRSELNVFGELLKDHDLLGEYMERLKSRGVRKRYRNELLERIG